MGAVNRFLNQREQINGFLAHMRRTEGRLDLAEKAALDLLGTDQEQQVELDRLLHAQIRHAQILVGLYVLASSWHPVRRWRARRELRRLFSGGKA